MFFVYLDTGIPVEATTEEEAIAKAKKVLREMLEEESEELEFVVEEE